MFFSSHSFALADIPPLNYYKPLNHLNARPFLSVPYCVSPFNKMQVVLKSSPEQCYHFRKELTCAVLLTDLNDQARAFRIDTVYSKGKQRSMPVYE